MNRANANAVLLCNARIVLPERTAESASLLIEDGRILRILDSSSNKSVKADSIVDLSGLILFPGFIDIHIHGAVGVDVMTASAAGLQRASQFLATKGVTAWLPTLVPAPQEQYTSAVGAIAQSITSQREEERTYWERGRRARTGEPPPPSEQDTASSEAHVLGVHYEGPFVNGEQCGALHGEHFKIFSGPADLDALPIPQVSESAKMMTVAPEIDGGIELIRELHKRGWIVSIGHTRATVEILERAHEEGARHLTHFMNAMAPLHHRAPGPIGWGLSHTDVTCDLIADGLHLDTFMLRLLLRLKTPERLSLISDAIAATGLGDGDYQIWGETISVTNGRTRNARGSIAGSVITMVDAGRMMMSLGVSEVDIARMASTNPARLLRVDRDYGSIEEGKRADLVAVDSRGEVRLTLVGGQVAHDSRRL